MESNKKMPVLFVGHGSPMNAIENNNFTKEWKEVAKLIPTPKAILSVSAHWFTRGTRILNASQPKMTYDMYGFPDELYQIVYSAPGAPELADKTAQLIKREVTVDNSWGFDHGTWSVLCRMYPKADIPVFQLSIDYDAPAETHFEIGRQISKLREQGVLILGSGNVVHNLARLSWDMQGGYDWAKEFDGYIKNNILDHQFDNVLHYERAGECHKPSFTYPDHFYPLLYVLGAADQSDPVQVFNDERTLGSLSMTCYLFG